MANIDVIQPSTKLLICAKSCCKIIILELETGKTAAYGTITSEVNKVVKYINPLALTLLIFMKDHPLRTKCLSWRTILFFI